MFNDNENNEETNKRNVAILEMRIMKLIIIVIIKSILL